MAKHTPGPWTFLEADNHEDEVNDGRPLTICTPNNDDLANVYSSDDSTVNIPRAEAVANAHLIAAAPDLLDALRELLGVCTQPTQQAARARAVIAALDAVRGTGWRDISEAPRDGTRVLVWIPSEHASAHNIQIAMTHPDFAMRTDAEAWQPLPPPPDAQETK